MRSNRCALNPLPNSRGVRSMLVNFVGYPSTRIRFACALILSILIAHATPGFAQALPKGGRLATNDELADEDRKDSPVRFANAAADFNGDGIVDQAFVLK